ncbi:creatinine amidohydrolase [Dethiosulfatibacter aminovorans DSM 17477]|uniref:Creatinine amidohydrolase n=1 Tax=Dethiosulfatibacter aminovorans DSM 17477 TaxID=1121476 RepID=A0A1M6M019_9FIRM|nr:creatininase family protein [Dethiosulfatibacter aminovorans]SHJ76788.1 creatinine amidohydrolase [Dethiosulfatibacter aminovorans DSM 17477]
MNSVWINELTWENVREYLNEDDLVIIPVGSTEQHGPAGPLGVDCYAAIAIAEDAAVKTNVLVTPPLWFSDSPHHLEFPGTISLKPETLINVIKDIVHSLERNGFKKFLIVNGHKGTNIPALTIACRELQQYELPNIRMALTDPLYLCTNASEVKGDNAEHHAGVLEISHVMYKFPGLVKESELPDEEVELHKVFDNYIKKDLFGGNKPVVELFWNSYQQKEFAPNGSFSASNNSSAVTGKHYHDNMVNNLVAFIKWFKTYNI